MPEKELGVITHYYDKINVAVVKLKDTLKLKDRVQVKGNSTEFEQEIISMQKDHKNIEKAEKGEEIGLKVNDRVKGGDKLYRV